MGVEAETTGEEWQIAGVWEETLSWSETVCAHSYCDAEVGGLCPYNAVNQQAVAVVWPWLHGVTVLLLIAFATPALLGLLQLQWPER